MKKKKGAVWKVVKVWVNVYRDMHVAHYVEKLAKASAQEDCIAIAVPLTGRYRVKRGE